MNDVFPVMLVDGFRCCFPAGIASVPFVRNVLDFDNAEIASIVKNLSDSFHLERREPWVVCGSHFFGNVSLLNALKPKGQRVRKLWCNNR